jgi:hypothetical protein
MIVRTDSCKPVWRLKPVGQLRALPQASGRMDVVRHAGSELKPGAADRLLSKLDVDDEICAEKWLHDEGRGCGACIEIRYDSWRRTAIAVWTAVVDSMLSVAARRSRKPRRSR